MKEKYVLEEPGIKESNDSKAFIELRFLSNNT